MFIFIRKKTEKLSSKKGIGVNPNQELVKEGVFKNINLDQEHTVKKYYLEKSRNARLHQDIYAERKQNLH